jgi:WD40 repeat protein
MGVVYKARQVQLNRLVALKMILAGSFAEEDQVARFRAEAEAVARIQHPHIVQIHEIGEADGRPYFSLEFVDGGSLDRKLNGTPLPARQAAEIVATLARAIHVAHTRGVVHRDLKPANVLLTPDGQPKVTDFGLAKSLDSEPGALVTGPARRSSARTQTGAILGTPSYMAPEQAAGKPAEIGPAADIYALGAILYELLTGRPPFKAATPLDTVLQVISEEPVPPAQLQPQLPRDLETVCLKCLRKEPRKRYASAQELADELARFLSGDPVLARPVGRLERTARWVRKHPGPATAAAAVAAVIGFVITFLAINQKQERERAEALEQANETAQRALADARRRKTEAEQAAGAARTAHNQAEKARRQAVAAERDGRRVKDAAIDQLYAARIDLAYREWQQNNAYRAEQLLNECPAALRGWEWDYLQGLCHQARMTLYGHTNAVHQVTVSPNGQFLASCDSSMGRVWDLVTGREVFSCEATGPVAFSPDGQRIALANNLWVRVYDFREGRERLALPDAPSQVVALAFADHGRQLLTVTLADSHLHRWDVATGNKLGQVALESGLFPINAFARYWPAFSADGNLLAAGADGGEVRVWDGRTGRRQHAFTNGPLMHVSRTAISPRGNRIAIAWAEGTVMVRELPSGKELRRWRAHKGSVDGLAFSPDGKRLATGSEDLAIRLWDLATFQEVLTLRGHTADVLTLAFTPNGKGLASGGNDRVLKVWDLADPRYFSSFRRQARNFRRLLVGAMDQLPPGSGEHRTFYGHLGPVRSLAFSADGRLAATANNGDGKVVVWDLANNREKFLLVIPPRHTCTLATAPDSNRLAGLCSPWTPAPGRIKLWDLSNGHLLLDRSAPPGSSGGLLVLPGGQTMIAALVRARSSRLYWFALPSGQVTGYLDLDGVIVHSLGRSPGGKQFVAGGQDQVITVDLDGRRVARSFKVPTMTTLAVSRQGLAATGHQDMVIRLHDLATGRLVRELEGHVGPLQSLAFSPDGQRLVSVTHEDAIKLWNATTGRELLTFRDHVRPVEQVAWSPDGRKVGSVSQDHSFRVWEAPAHSTESADDWPVLFTDRFNRKTLGSLWAQGSNWGIENRALRATLVDTFTRGAWDKYPAALVPLAGVRLPDTVEVRCEVLAPHRLNCALALTDPDTGLRIEPLLLGSERALGYTGAALQLVRRDGLESTLAGVPRKAFRFLPGRHYQVRVRRERTRLTLMVDGEVVLRETIPGTPAPLLVLTASWGQVGDAVYFDNLEIRAPQAAVREQVLRDMVKAQFDRYHFRAAVEEEIQKNAALTDADRRFLRSQLGTLRENAQDLLLASTVVALQPGGSPAFYQLAIRQAQAVLRLTPSNWSAHFTLGLARYGAGQPAEAEASLLQAQAVHRQSWGSNAPSIRAVLAMVHHRLGQAELAHKDLDGARDLMRAGYWVEAEPARTLVAQAEALIGRPKPTDREAEAVKQVIFNAEQAGWGHGDLAGYLGAFTEDCRVVDGRGEQADRWDVVYDHKHLREVRRWQLPSAASIGVRFRYEDVRVRIGPAEAECRYRVTTAPGSGYSTWEVRAWLRKTPWGWKIASTRGWPVAEKGVTLRKYDGAYWTAMDEVVLKAHQASTPRRLARALEEARQYSALLPVARELTAKRMATAEDWALLGRTAFVLGQTQEALAAFHQALSKNPGLELPWYLTRLRQTVYHVGNAVFGVDWNGTRPQLLTGGSDGVPRLCDARTGSVTRSLPRMPGWISSVAFQPGGKLVAAGGTDRVVKLWDATNGREWRALVGHEGRVYRLAFDPKGRRLVTASADGTARIWDLVGGRHPVILPHGGEVLGAVFSPDGKHVATAGRDATAAIWDATTGSRILRLRGHQEEVYRVAYHPSGTRLATAGSDKTVRLWDARTGKELHRLDGHRGGVEVVTFSPNGRQLVSGGYDSTIILWDPETGKAQEYLRGHGGSIFALAFRADGRRLASAAGDGEVRIWDMGKW